MTRIIIAGGRDFNNYNLLKETMWNIFIDRPTDKSFVEIISGCANGADKLGILYANDYGINLKKFPADWDKFGKSAGYIRNKEMAKYAREENGVLIAFWDGQSKGTRHMIDLANEYKLEVHVIKY